MTKALAHITELIKNNLDTLANNDINLSLSDELVIDNARITLAFNLSAKKTVQILKISAMAIDKLTIDAETMSISLDGKAFSTDDYSISQWHSAPIHNAIHSDLLNEQMIKFADKCFQRFVNNGLA